MFKIKNKKLVGIGLLASLLCTNALALENESYIGIKGGATSFDKTVIANVSGQENVGPYSKYKDVSLVGLDYQSLYTPENSSLLFGYGVDLLFNKGNFLEGGTIDIDFKLGAKINSTKLYGMVGYGLQSLSDYTAATGSYAGIGATYDISKNIAVHTSYRKHTMTTTVSDYNHDYSDNQKYESKGFLFGLAYKY